VSHETPPPTGLLKAVSPLTATVAEDVAIVHGAFVDPDGAGPLPPQPLPTQQESEGVEIIYPTGVMLTDLSGVAQADGVLLGWQMANEAAVLGFNVLRGEAGGEWVLLNQEFIFAQYAGAGRGAVYTYQDDAVISGITYEYVLQVVTTDGRVEQYGPTRVTVGWWVRLPLIAR